MSQDTGIAAERLAAAHKALRADPSIQFQLQAPLPRPTTPEWLRALVEGIDEALKPVGRFMAWIGGFLPDAPYARILLWSVVALIAAFLLWEIWMRIGHRRWLWPSLRRRSHEDVVGEAEDWSPGDAPVRAWLSEADALAESGRFADAVHHLLFRSIEDIAHRRPQLVRPALTSRELAAAEALPDGARQLFASIAGLVEQSLFGGRSLEANDWSTARAAYADFALPKAWRR